MKAFEFDHRLIDSYARFSRSFSTVRSDDLKSEIDRQYDAGRFWPNALLSLNPRYLQGPTVDDLVASGDLDEATGSIFRFEAEPVRFHRHQAQSIAKALANHGFSLLRAAMALRARDGSAELASKAFERAGNAFEALIKNADPEAADRGFRRTIAAAAYHLAGFSAVAYSLFNEAADGLNLTPGEAAVMRLILRDLDGLRTFVRGWLNDNSHSDGRIAARLSGDDADLDEILATVLNTTMCRALAFFDFALETGEEEPLKTARSLLDGAVSVADNAENVPLWWMTNLCRHLIDDLWQHSLHRNLPTQPPEGAEEQYPDLRRLFISSLYARKISEVELWPSQREAARRSTYVNDDLVVALPTSAGKTRVAEITALMTLSLARRVLIVTPLRALSAQTERSFRKTFAPLGFSVSSLYGASEVSAGDEDALRSREIVIATPEKLDLVEALDADRADLPKLLDEALKGSLWARQIAREGEGAEAQHRKVFEARANLIWSVTTPQARRGHFAMGVGLEAVPVLARMSAKRAKGYRNLGYSVG